MHCLPYRKIPFSFSGTQLKKYYLKYIFTVNGNIKWKTFCLISSFSPPTNFKVRIALVVFSTPAKCKSLILEPREIFLLENLTMLLGCFCCLL